MKSLGMVSPRCDLQRSYGLVGIIGVIGRARVAASAGVCLLLILESPVTANTLQVPTDYSTIQTAIDAAVDGDEIAVSPGTYRVALNFHHKSIRVSGTDGAE